ncbi:glycosyltransferase [Bacillus sp. DNRA2]|uniref:glycosyltransferase family 2 protein n=1 Tax=Bacillus sp. DNRA2 TaxID=2723053 RepID=UPI00145E6B10|nr:glycosyltransferase [Bacillus sp. DNRA2]NMD70479.1 glycosyltransferase [Bacillus sp. DNRA2]
MKKRLLSIVIPACNEEETISQVIQSCLQLAPFEIIVVANGCTDSTVNIAKNSSPIVKVIQIDSPLGNDVGRAIGADAAQAEVVLFLDADFSIPTAQLELFLSPILTGETDVVLNDLSSLFHEKKRPHSITVWRQVMNSAIIQKPTIGINSTLSVPHAITKKAIQQIGSKNLAYPILAQLLLMSNPTLAVRHYPIEVIKLNRYRPELHQTNPIQLSISEKRMIGDHLFALHRHLEKTNSRGNFADGDRNRKIIEDLTNQQRTLRVSPGRKIINHSNLYGGQSLSVVIPVQNEAHTIAHVINEVRKIEPSEIIVVVNGTTDNTAALAKACGATTVEIESRLGNDVGRSIGAMLATGDIILFIDGDFPIPAKDLFPYAKAISNGIDLTLNNLDYYLDLRFPLNIVTALKYAVNLAYDHKDLGIGSMVAVPHALSRKALNRIGVECLLSPVVAQGKIMLNNTLKIKNIHLVEVDKLNKIRPSEHFSKSGFPKAVERIIGDHIEGLSYLFMQTSERGLFAEDQRRIHLLDQFIK